MDQSICRTCLKTDFSSTTFVKIFNNTEPNQLTIKEMLEIFMPELDLDIFEGEMVICFECLQALQNAYMFKNKCLKTEEKIYDYLHKYNIKLGRKISLHNILEHKMIDLSFGQLINDVTDFEITPLQDIVSNKIVKAIEAPSDRFVMQSQGSNQSDVENFKKDSIDSVQPSSESEDIASAPPLRRKKCKRASFKKETKEYEYNSMKRSYICDQCEYKAYRLDLLNTHKQKHDKNMLNVKEYKCDLCMYSTLRKRALDRHLFTHKGKSRHACDVCNKSFAEKYRLKLHQITHTGQELPHKCVECGKGFLTKSYLKQHMETRHLAKEKRVCSECPQGNCGHLFTRYKCGMCEASFSDKRGLDAHKFTHIGGELPFKCLYCTFSTAWKGNLKKHLQNKH